MKNVMAVPNKSGRQVAFIRGINVGRAKRVAMADLRELVTDLGYTEVRTLLNSGNVVFTVPTAGSRNPALQIEEGISKRLGVSARVFVLTAEEVAAAVIENPLGDVAHDHSRLLVAVLGKAADRDRLELLLRKDWTPDGLALGARVAYMWCASGLLESQLAVAVNRALGENMTARNFATMTKLHAMVMD